MSHAAATPGPAAPRGHHRGRLSHVSTRVGSLAVEEIGQGPPLLLWPSLLSDRHLWRHQRDALAPHHRLLLVDPPGHGESGPPRGRYRLEDCARAGTEVLDAFEVSSAVWVGLSWGGMTALYAALRHPERVRALALLDTSADRLRLGERLRFRLLAALFRRTGLTPFLARRVAAELLGATTLRERPDLAAELTGPLALLERGGVLRAIDAVLFRRRTFTGELGGVAAPALVVVGEEDRSTPAVHAERIAAALPRARLERVPRAGHLTALEAPEAVNRLLAGFLAEL
ncbi:MAG TPA: alpha/beta fold hydrolase [Thermoanaerobaculia bacterium]|nr:alpha/beta fold hydrolase [Thermoanaerobaculia bacterium]